MSSSRFTYLWVQDGIPARRFLDGESAPLRTRLDELAGDESRSSEALVLDAAHAVFGWALEHDESWESARAGTELEAGIAGLEERHGWRGPLAIFLDSLRLSWKHSLEDSSWPVRRALSEEAGFWIRSQREDLEPRAASDLDSKTVEWDGRALAPGRRMPARGELAREAAAVLETDETILVHGFSEGLARALELALRAGKRPRVLCGEGLPLLEGRRLARRLAALELPLTLVYDARLPDLVPEADRIWLASEALGARALLAQAGARRLAREALEHGVPLQVLATSDALLPGGALTLPRWMEQDRSLLWVEAPRTVELRTSFLEELSLEDVPEFLTEKGRESARTLVLRSLRLERAARCDAPAPAFAPAPNAEDRGLLRPARRAGPLPRSAEEHRTRTSS